jgi:hypothetical protein
VSGGCAKGAERHRKGALTVTAKSDRITNPRVGCTWEPTPASPAHDPRVFTPSPLLPAAGVQPHARPLALCVPRSAHLHVASSS